MARAPLEARGALPPQGLYEQCAPNSSTPDCGARLQLISRAGFSHVLNYTSWFGTPEEVVRFADQAQAADIKVIWPLNDPAWRDGTDLRAHYRYLGPHCGCETNDQFKRFAIDLVKDHPATWGFYIGDEVRPTPGNVAQVAELASQVRQLAPAKPTLYVTLPKRDLFSQLEPFAPLADFAGTDYYPVGLAPDLGRVPAVARQTRSVTSSQGTRPVLVLQSFSWSQYYDDRAKRFPTHREMREMRDMALRWGRPRLLLWYSLNDVLDSDRPWSRWRDLHTAAFAPQIAVRRMPARCVRVPFAVRVRIRAGSRLRGARAAVGRRQLLLTKRHRFAVRVPSRRLRAGRYRLRVVAVDRTGHRATRIVGFSRCRHR